MKHTTLDSAIIFALSLNEKVPSEITWDPYTGNFHVYHCHHDSIDVGEIPLGDLVSQLGESQAGAIRLREAAPAPEWWTAEDCYGNTSVHEDKAAAEVAAYSDNDNPEWEPGDPVPLASFVRGPFPSWEAAWEVEARQGGSRDAAADGRRTGGECRMTSQIDEILAGQTADKPYLCQLETGRKWLSAPTADDMAAQIISSQLASGEPLKIRLGAVVPNGDKNDWQTRGEFAAHPCHGGCAIVAGHWTHWSEENVRAALEGLEQAVIEEDPRVAEILVCRYGKTDVTALREAVRKDRELQARLA